MSQTDRAARVGQGADPGRGFRLRQPPRDTLEFSMGLFVGLVVGAAFTLGLKQFF